MPFLITLFFAATATCTTIVIPIVNNTEEYAQLRKLEISNGTRAQETECISMHFGWGIVIIGILLLEIVLVTNVLSVHHSMLSRRRQERNNRLRLELPPPYTA